MPTGQNANHAKCQPFVGILSVLFFEVGISSVPIFGWHFVRTISTCFGILSESWKMSSFEWVWVRLCTVSRCTLILALVGHSYKAHLHNSKCSEDGIRWSQRFSYVLRRFHYILSVLVWSRFQFWKIWYRNKRFSISFGQNFGIVIQWSWSSKSWQFLDQCTMRLPMSIDISEVFKCKHSFHAHFK